MELKIDCPKCKEHIFDLDGRTTLNITGKCKNCNKLIVYDAKTKEVKMRNIPPRATSSGLRFY